MVPLSFAGHRLFVAGDAALWWPARRALLLADLHLEKGSFFAAAGQMLPPYDSRATMEAIDALVASTRPERVFCLGDNYHDDAGEARLAPCAASILQRLTGTLDWIWIRGNHDREVRGRWGGRARAAGRWPNWRNMGCCCGTRPNRAKPGQSCPAISTPSCA